MNALGSKDMVILILLICEHRISFHLFVSSSILVINVLWFSNIQIFFPSMLKFIPMHFILFDVIVNGIVFLIYLSDSILLV